jgi:hypothetical protein
VGDNTALANCSVQAFLSIEYTIRLSRGQ